MSNVGSYHAIVENQEFFDNHISKFWELETIPIADPSILMSNDDRKCESHFVNIFSRDESGKFIVRFPFKGDNPQFPNSFHIAKKSFINLEKRLTKNPELLSKYKDSMNDYISLNHMKYITSLYKPESFFDTNQNFIFTSSWSYSKWKKVKSCL